MIKKLTTPIFTIIFVMGVVLVLYPPISNYWNNLHQTQIINEYTKVVENVSQEEANKLIEEAQKYNEKLVNKSINTNLSEKELEEYNNILNVDSNGMMGYIEIPKIELYLPIYHGTTSSVMKVGVGHMEGTSFPIGGKGTHSVIAGHTGLTTAKLFTDIDQLVIGDVFYIHVLDKVLKYKVDFITIVEPNEIENIEVDSEKDYVTLLTCTPYGINTHRLLVRGYHIDDENDTEVNDIIYENNISKKMLIKCLVIIIFIIVFLFIVIKRNIVKKKKSKH